MLTNVDRRSGVDSVDIESQNGFDQNQQDKQSQYVYNYVIRYAGGITNSETGQAQVCLLAQLLMTTWPLLKASNFPKRSKTAKEWRKSLKVVKRDDCDSFHAGISHKICHHIHNFSDFFVNWNIQVTLVKQWLSLITGPGQFCCFAPCLRSEDLAECGGFGVSQRCRKKTQGDSSVMWLINDLNILKHLDILGYTWIYYDEHTISWYTWHRMNSWTWVEWTLMALMFVRTIMEKPQREDHFCPGSGHCP